MKERIILGFSGGLDTTFLLKYLQEKYDYSVVCVTIDIGQAEDMDLIKEKAEKLKCEKIFLIDGKEDFVKFFIEPAIQANTLYQNQYPLATALSRPYIGYKMAEIAKSEGIKALGHGCTGKGNDQIRIEMAIKAVIPDAKIIDPIRDEGYYRDTEVEYLRKMNIADDNLFRQKVYSIDMNLWGRAICAGDLEDPWNAPGENAFEWTKSIDNAKNTPDIIEIEFREGIPVSLNNEQLSLSMIIEKLNKLGGEHGFGRIDHIEDRIIGIKSREVYEAPAAMIIIRAHQALESMTLTKRSLEFKKSVDTEFSEIVYDGYWFSSHNIDILHYLKSNQKHVTGTVRLKLYKGNCMVEGRKSPNSLYDHKIITYNSDSIFNQLAAKYFVDIYSLQNAVEVNKRFLTFDKETFQLEDK